MKNFSDLEVIGGSPFCPGSKFDDFNKLIDTYFSFLIYSIVTEGITYSTERNGILAKVKLGKQGFINYVQPSIGKWNYEDPKYQRIVSPDFVLYVFNNICLANCFNTINYLGESKKFNLPIELQQDELDINTFDVREIIEMHEEFLDEFFKYKNGQVNHFNDIPKGDFLMIHNLYILIERIYEYSAEIEDRYIGSIQYEELTEKIHNNLISYNDLTEEQEFLLKNSHHFSGTYEDCPRGYLSLGCLNNVIRSYAIEAIKKYKMSTQKQSDEIFGYIMYDDPISIDEYFEPLEFKEDNDLSFIDYIGAKEFENDSQRTKLY